MRRGLGLGICFVLVVLSGCKGDTTFNVKDSCHDFAKHRILADPHPHFSAETVKETGTDKKTGLPRWLLSGHVSWTDLDGPHQTFYACEVLVDKAAKKVRLSDLEIPGT